MSVYGNSAAREAAAIRRRARRGIRGHVTAWVGMSPEAARADAVAARWELGARAEKQTARMVRRLRWQGWRIRHDLRLTGRRFNLDHVLVSPCGTAVVVADTKRWHAGWPTAEVGGRLYCGREDRHREAETAARYAQLVGQALRLPGVAVWPVLVVHGSRVADGVLTVRVPGWPGPVFVLSPSHLVPTLARAPQSRDPRRAAAVAARVDAVLRPYGEGG